MGPAVGRSQVALVSVTIRNTPKSDPLEEKSRRTPLLRVRCLWRSGPGCRALPGGTRLSNHPEHAQVRPTGRKNQDTVAKGSPATPPKKSRRTPWLRVRCPRRSGSGCRVATVSVTTQVRPTGKILNRSEVGGRGVALVLVTTPGRPTGKAVVRGEVGRVSLLSFRTR